MTTDYVATTAVTNQALPTKQTKTKVIYEYASEYDEEEEGESYESGDDDENNDQNDDDSDDADFEI